MREWWEDTLSGSRQVGLAWVAALEDPTFVLHGPNRESSYAPHALLS
jgi:hypothetical protein